MGPVSVGTIEVASTFDTVRLEEGPFGYRFDIRRGPFWNGDGDYVTLSIEGAPGVMPPLFRRMPAPVPDVVARFPTEAERNGPLVVGWRYAHGETPALGHMTVGISQFGGSGPVRGPAPAVSVVCGTAAARGSIRIPPSVTQRFQPGDAFVSISSTVEERYVAEGALKLYVDVTAQVDTGGAGGVAPPGSGSIITFR
jgi:hypothetical protein